MSAGTDDADADAVDEAAVYGRLDRVTDPELDESIVELGYVDEVRIDGDGGAETGASVHVAFTLPTAWCSPAFAWMMASDARDEVESLPGVGRARVRLRDHMHDTEINEGIERGASFGESFPDAAGGVADVRATLDDKARQARQHDAFEALADAGLSAEQVAGLTLGDLALDADPAGVRVRDGAVVVVVDADPIRAYLRKGRETGLFDDDPDARAFRTPEGDPIDADEFETVRARARLASVNMSGQGGVCDALNESRRRALGRD